MVRSAIPQPIRDPNTGKTLVPIPAPSFVLSSANSKLPHSKLQREHIYVERKDAPAKRIESHKEKVTGERKRPSVRKWVVRVILYLAFELQGIYLFQG